MIDGKNFFDQPVKNYKATDEYKLQLVKELITQLLVFWIILILKKLIRRL